MRHTPNIAPREADVIVNGTRLSAPQATTLRTALSSMMMNLAADPKALGDDAHGHTMRDGYLHHGRQVEQMLVTAAPDVDAVAIELWKAADACGFDQFRDLVRTALTAPVAPAAAAPEGDAEHTAVIDVRDLFDFLRAAWREGQHYDREDTPDQANSWSAASDYANKVIEKWTGKKPTAQPDETAHLLASPANAERLARSIAEFKAAPPDERAPSPFADDDERALFIQTMEEFEDCNETATDDRLLMKWACAGLLECNSYLTTEKGQTVFTAARTALQGDKQ